MPKLPAVPPAEAARIRAEIQKLRDRDPEAVKRFKAVRRQSDAGFKSLQDAIDDSERLTAADYAVYINAR